MMTKKLTHDLDTKRIEKHFQGHIPYCTIDPQNIPKEDTLEWVENDRMDALVGDDGIIGFIHKDYSEDVAAALNLIVMRNNKADEDVYIREVAALLKSLEEEEQE